MEDIWMSEAEAAEYTGFPHRTLQLWRKRGKGPRFFQNGNNGQVRYRREWLDSFVEANTAGEPAEGA